MSVKQSRASGVTYFRSRSSQNHARALSVGALPPARADVRGEWRGELVHAWEASCSDGCLGVRRDDQHFVRVPDKLKPSERTQVLLFQGSSVS